MTKNLLHLLLSATFVAATYGQLSGAEPAVVDSGAAHDLAVEALKAEAEGDFLTRQRLLAEALGSESNCPLLNAQLGKIAIALDDWRSVDECVELASANSTLQQYLLTRGTRELGVSEHFTMGQWCYRVGLIAQAHAHLERVIRMEPEHTAARLLLGYQRFGDEWVSPAEILGLRMRAQFTASSLERFGDKLFAIHKKLRDQRPAERLQARDELLELKDPQAIPAVETIFADAVPEIAKLVVAWMKQTDAVESSQVLTRYALFHPLAEIRAIAEQGLGARPLHDFVPDVLAMTTSPVATMLVPVLNPDRTLAGYRQAFGQETSKSRQLVVVDSVIQRVNISMVRGEGSMLKPTGRSEITAVNQAIEFAVNRAANEDAAARQMAAQRENAAIASRNALIGRFLSNVTGNEIKPTADGIWQWWDQENESISQLAKPRSVSRLAIGHSVPRYQAYEAYEPVPYEPKEMSPETLAALQQMYQRQAEFRVRVNAGTAPRPECFAAGTPVVTLQGLRPIESIRTGDLVLTNNLREGSLVWQAVIEATQRRPEPTYEVKTAFDKFRCTGGHLFWVSGKGWTKARELVSGDVLHAAREPAVVCSVLEQPAILTHNLAVAGNANYFVGDEMVLTHDVTEMLPSRTKVPGLSEVASN